MSITDSFRNLNESIRGIRNDRQVHEQRVMNLKMKDAELQRQMNDPRIRLEKEKAEKELEPTKVGPIYNKKFQSGITDNLEQEMTEKINTFAPEGTEFRNGTYFKKDTNEEAMLPGWQVRDLRSKTQMIMTATLSPGKTLNASIERLDERISNLKEKNSLEGASGNRYNIYYVQQAKLEQERDSLKEKRDDPDEQIRRHGTYREYLKNMTNTMMSSGNVDKELLKMMDSLYNDSFNEEQLIRRDKKSKDNDPVPSDRKLGYEQYLADFKGNPSKYGTVETEPTEGQKVRGEVIKSGDKFYRRKRMDEYVNQHWDKSGQEDSKNIDITLNKGADLVKSMLSDDIRTLGIDKKSVYREYIKVGKDLGGSAGIQAAMDEIERQSLALADKAQLPNATPEDKKKAQEASKTETWFKKTFKKHMKSNYNIDVYTEPKEPKKPEDKVNSALKKHGLE